MGLIKDLAAENKNGCALSGVSLKEYVSSYINFIWWKYYLFPLHKKSGLVFLFY